MGTGIAAAADPVRAAVLGPEVAADVVGAGRHAAYLRLPGDRLIALLGAEAVALPIGVVLPADARLPLGDLAGRVTVGAGWIRAARLQVEITDRFATAVEAVEPAPGALDWVRARAALLPRSATGLSAAQLDLLAGGDADATVEALLGAGPGLTPAGDDALCGILVAAAAGLCTSGGAVRTALATRPGTTTELSAALLRMAAAGHAATPVRALVAALGEPARLAARWAAVLRIGHTSGAALAAGFGAALTWARS